MQDVLFYIRDHLVGTHYIIYAFILFFFMFAIIGYLFKEKYAKYEIKLNTSQGKKEEKTQKQTVKSEAVIQKKIEKPKKVVAQTPKEVVNGQTPQKVTTTVKVESPKQQTVATTVASIPTNPTPTPASVAKPTPSPAPIPAAPHVKNPTPMPNTGTSVNPTPVTTQQPKPLESAVIPEI